MHAKTWLNLKIIKMNKRIQTKKKKKESACKVGDLGSNRGLGRFPGVGNGNPLQYSCLENSMNRGAWWVTVYGIRRVRHNGAINSFFQTLVVAYRFFSCGMQDLAPRPGIEPMPPALEVWSLSHWTTREVQDPLLLKVVVFFLVSY